MADVLKLKKQLTRTRVVVFILLALCFLFFAFAYVQKLEADEQTELAFKLEKTAEEARTEAEQQRIISMQNEAEAVKQKMQGAVNANEAIEKLGTVDQLKKELEAQRKIAEQQKELAIKNAEIARQNEEQAIIARHAETVANKALEDCKKKIN